MKLGLWKRVSLMLKYFSKSDAELRDFAIGMNSEVNINKDLHILFLDFDKADLSEVEESVSECQGFWNLSDAYIYKTRNGYHAYFFYDIMPYPRVVMIINYAKYVDDMFRYISRYYDYKTIRQSGKYKERDISFVKVLKGKRSPTAWEAEIGDLKRKEKGYLSDMGDMLRKDRLKE
jgi:predicted RNA-binding protein with PUA-like domain